MYNPIINFIFYIGAIVLGMFFMHPAFLACSVLMSATLYVTVKGQKALKFLFGMIPVFIVVSLINPIFNTYGQTVLFTYFGRPYTLEALFYGMAVASMFVSVLLWFASYNVIVTSDKFLYIFGKIIPSVSMIFTMVLRFIPNYRNKFTQISTARKCIGKSGNKEDKKQQIEDGVTEVSALTSWAFEGGIITADSMRSRGYGIGKRTNFSIYNFGTADKLLAAFLFVLAGCTVFCGAMGAARVSYTPILDIQSISNPYTVVGLISYFMFLVTPTALNITEEMTWRILRSKI